jgi:hypothetical protein
VVEHAGLTTPVARIALVTAAIASVAEGLLLGAASLGILMEGANLHPTPRVNASTVGLALSPVAALAWIAYLWTRTRPRRFLDFAMRSVVSFLLLVVAAYCLFAAMFEAFFVG